MANNKAKIEQNATRIVQWFAEHCPAFEQDGVDEATLADSLGLAHDEVTQAVDHLENREVLVRFLHTSTTPSSIILKPGRGWADFVKKEAQEGRAANP